MAHCWGELAWGNGGLSGLPWAATGGRTLETWRRQTGSEREAKSEKYHLHNFAESLPCSPHPL